MNKCNRQGCPHDAAWSVRLMLVCKNPIARLLLKPCACFIGLECCKAHVNDVVRDGLEKFCVEETKRALTAAAKMYWRRNDEIDFKDSWIDAISVNSKEYQNYLRLTKEKRT